MQITQMAARSYLTVGAHVCGITVMPIRHGESEGVMAMAFLHEGAFPRRVELRKKHGRVALLSHQYSDVEVPYEWRDAEVVWSQEIDKYLEGRGR